MTAGLEVSLRLSLGGLVLTLDLEVRPGGPPVALVGPNGAGKTSALLAVLGILRPQVGHVRLGGLPLFEAAAGIDRPPEERGIAWVPQDYALFPHLSAERNVEFALAGLDGPPPRVERRQRARGLLAELGVGDVAARLPAALSGGERQRVALARALARQPQALLFDEPFAALDAGARGEVRRYLGERLRVLGLPALVVTHDRADVEALDAVVVVLEQGRVVQRGTLADLTAHPATEYVASFCAAR